MFRDLITFILNSLRIIFNILDLKYKQKQGDITEETFRSRLVDIILLAVIVIYPIASDILEMLSSVILLI